MVINPDYDKRVLPYGTIANYCGMQRDCSIFRDKTNGYKREYIKPWPYRNTSQSDIRKSQLVLATADITNKF